MQNEDIIRAIQENRSQELAKVLYKTALPPIKVYIRQKRGTKLDAEDCFQEAVMVLIRNVREGKYDDSFEVKNFLFVIARNIWFNKLRRMGKVNSEDATEMEFHDQDVDIEKSMIDKERIEMINGFLDQAGEKCRELLHYIIFESRKLKEIAQIMGFGSDQVAKTTSYRCKKKLKEILSKDPKLVKMIRGEF